MSKKAVIIYSGGMDSTVLLYQLLAEGFEVKALSFDYGQRHIRETLAARAICELVKVPHEVVDLSALAKLLPGSSQTDESVPVPEGHYAAENMKLTVVPNRNMIMLSVACAHALAMEYGWVAFGAHAGDHTIYPDCRPEFVHAMNKTMSKADWKQVSIVAPFIFMDKGDIAKRGHELCVPFELTWTCYKGEHKHCGKCGACQERKEAFQKFRIMDPTDYHMDTDLKA
jgi:7-cyano-7-deazaguanine synthase